MNVAENLYDYLKHNDKAELLGFGTFYVKSSSAKINHNTGNIEPPKKEIIFKKEISGDTSFVTFMAQNEFISEQTAATWIKQYSDSLNEKIKNGRTIVLEKIGKIEKGILDELVFTFDEKSNLLDNAFEFGELKDLQTFDNEEEKIEVLETSQKPIENNETQQMPKEFEEKKNEIQQQIDQAKQLKEEDKIKENEQQTEQRIIHHTQAVINSTITAPENLQSSNEKLDIDTTPKEDKTQQTIDRAEQFKENVIVEDIKPAKKQENKEEEQTNITPQKEDKLKKQAEIIVDKHTKKDNIKTQKENKKKKNKFWTFLFWLILILLLLCVAFVGCHWYGLLKDVEFLKPVTDKLSYYIQPKQSNNTKTIVVEETNTVETVTEEYYDGVIEYEENDMMTEYEQQSTNPVNTTTKQQNNSAKQTNKPKKDNTKNEDDTQQPTIQENVVVDNSPIVTQNYSKLGFDVVSGYYSDKSKAEEQARKARRLGYDGYVLSKIKAGTPIYYVSYGSRRTLHEANDLMESMINRLGGNYSVISR